MKVIFKFFYVPFFVLIAVFVLTSFIKPNDDSIAKAFKKAGLTDRQAALHLLNRFTYGPKPNDIDAVLKIGIDNWFNQQLQAKMADDDLKNRLKDYSAVDLSNEQVVKIYPRGPIILRMAIKDGFINKDSVSQQGKQAYRQDLKKYMQKNGLLPEQELIREFISQKILRAAYTNNQFQEVMTDFWFNHFNVSLTKPQSARFIPAYERDIIRPNVFGKFETLLLSTAKSTAMLTFLDNFSSVKADDEMVSSKKPQKKAKGINENYAREVMELHTLGVDGGYTQSDVTQAARVLTGWTYYPTLSDGGGGGMVNNLEKIGAANMAKRGFMHDGDFLFVASRHDTGKKVVLGRDFSDGGYQEGVELLDMLAHHPSTAKFISKKLAARFVNDNPSQRLIDLMAKTFLEKKGDIKAVMITMVTAPEFWSSDALGEKTKSPFELAISAVRALDADVVQPYQLFSWINKMGQKIYYYQAPTGFPDRGQYWINTGALLNRMNFGLALAGQKINGVKVNLAKLNNNHEPESSEAALRTYGKIILPDRDLTKTIERLNPFLNDPNLANKIDQAAKKNKAPTMVMDEPSEEMSPKSKVLKPEPVDRPKPKSSFENSAMLAQVVGVIIGAPEFQKR